MRYQPVHTMIIVPGVLATNKVEAEPHLDGKHQRLERLICRRSSCSSGNFAGGVHLCRS